LVPGSEESDDGCSNPTIFEGTGAVMNNLWQDLRYAVRVLGKSPGFTAVAVLTLALGIGANTAIFSVVNAVLLRSLPYPRPQRIVQLQDFNPKRASNPSLIGVPRLQDVFSENHVFNAVAYHFFDNATLTLPGKLPERVVASCVSGGFWDAMSVQPLLGRTFDASGDTPNSPDYAVLSYGLWQRLFGGDRSIIGQAITLDGKASTVLGVMPPSFNYPSGTEMWRTTHFPLWQITSRNDGSRFMGAIARLKPDISQQSAQNELDLIASRLSRQHPQTDADWLFRMTTLRDVLVGNVRTALLVLMFAVAIVMLIACANVTNLLLSRAASRQREVAIRQALGASRGRLVAQFLTEAVLLSLMGGGMGVAAVGPFLHVLVSRLPVGTLPPDAIRIDLGVLGFTFGICVLTGVFLGLAPALSLVRRDVQSTLKEAEGRAFTRGSHRFRGFMIATEVGLSLVLLVGAGLLMETFWNLEQVNLGFNPDHVLTFEISLPWGTNATVLHNFYSDLVQRVSAIRGVRAAGTVTRLPLETFHLPRAFWTADRSQIAIAGNILAETRSVSGDYFQAMGIPLMAGRFFTAHDEQTNAPGTILISTLFADQYFPNENPVGKRLQFDGGSGEIIGVVGTVRGEGANLQTASTPQAYWPDMGGFPNNQFAVRTSVPPETLINVIREQVREVDPNRAIHSVATMESNVDDAVAQPRLDMFLLASFAGLALILAVVGLYGVIAYLVAERTREIGIRMALGAQRSQILQLFVGQGMRWAFLGASAGLVVALVLVRFMRSLLFGVAPYDMRIFAGVASFLILIVLLACYIPARRAAKVDPMVALRYE